MLETARNRGGRNAKRTDRCHTPRLPGRRTGQACPDHDPGIAAGNTARVYNFDVARLTVLLEKPTPPRIDELLTLSELSFTVGTVFFSFGPHTP